MVLNDLLELPHLRLEVWAGRHGTDHQVTWAQTSDLDAPWDFLTGGELLMKNGRTMPTTNSEQVQFVEGVATHGISGLILGMDPDTPLIGTEALARADELAFPVIVAPYSVGFGAIGRAVADHNVTDESRRLAVTGRVYTMIRRAVTLPSGNAFAPLERDLACKVAVLDAETGNTVLDDADGIAEHLRRALTEEVRRRGGAIPGVIHLEANGIRAQVVDVPDEEPTILVTYSFRATPPDLVLLQHLATAAAVLIAQQGIRREHERRVGGEMLAAIMDRRIGDAEACAFLQTRGLDLDQCVIVAAQGGSRDAEQQVHLTLHRRRVPNVLVRRADMLYALVSPQREAIGVLHRRLGSRATVGVSDPLRSLERAPDAVREALWAVRDAIHAPGNISRYADATLLSILRDTTEARVVVDRTLGPLLRYDAGHGSELVRTLDVFLSANRSWQAAAAELGVHRQTVVYRMRRVSEITGRDLSATGHIADLWLALRARDLVSS